LKTERTEISVGLDPGHSVLEFIGAPDIADFAFALVFLLHRGVAGLGLDLLAASGEDQGGQQSTRAARGRRDAWEWVLDWHENFPLCW
jgi:hypothetical protein